MSLRIISLGAGVQSSTMALMFKHGELGPMPDCAIFSDTQAEPAEVYKWLDYLDTTLPFPIHRVTGGSLKETLIAAGHGQRFVAIPAFVLGEDDEKGLGRRQCTNEFKLRPIQRKVQELCGFIPGRPLPKGVEAAHVLIGISTDEFDRARRSDVTYIINEHPLLDAKVSRDDCVLWMKDHGYPVPPKSSCSFCPFHNNALWRHIRDTDPKAWADAVEVDAAIRKTRGFDGEQFLHSQRVPLGEADLTIKEREKQRDLFRLECHGMCGV